MERAAGGSKGQAFPWGYEWQENCANTDEAGIGDTSAVGAFPDGASETGCLDIAGNVWEWTRSLWDKDRSMRVLRGGSFYVNRNLARCAVRDRLHPDDRSYNVGFRVVLRSAPVSQLWSLEVLFWHSGSSAPEGCGEAFPARATRAVLLGGFQNEDVVFLRQERVDVHLAPT